MPEAKYFLTTANLEIRIFTARKLIIESTDIHLQVTDYYHHVKHCQAYINIKVLIFSDRKRIKCENLEIILQ